MDVEQTFCASFSNLWLLCPHHTPLRPFGHADDHSLMLQHSLGYFILTTDLGLERVSC